MEEKYYYKTQPCSKDQEKKETGQKWNHLHYPHHQNKVSYLDNCSFIPSLLSSLDCKEIKPVNPKRNQCWIFFGRTDAEAETPIFWPTDAKSWLIGKDPDAGKDWGQEEKGTTEDEIVDGITDLMDMSLSNSRRWWWTGKPGVLQFIGSQRVWHHRTNELNLIAVQSSPGV